MNGDLLRATGRGMETLSPRELCDVAWSAMLEGIEKQYYAMVAAGIKFEAEDPMADQVTRLEEKIGLRYNPEDLALELHKTLLAARGIEWDDTPVGAGSGKWWDQDIDNFKDMSDLDAASKKKRVSRLLGAFKGSKA